MRLFTLLICLLAPVSAYAEDLYYGESTAGLADGSSCANRLAASTFNTPGHWTSGAGKISPGDTAHLCSTIATAMVAKGSGTAGNVITILFESGAKISQPLCPNADSPSTASCLNLYNKSFITVNGGTNGIIENTANGTGLANQVKTVLLYAELCSNCEVKNLTIKNSYVHTGDLSDTTLPASANAVGLEISGDNVLVHDNTFTDNGWSIYYIGRNVSYSGVQIYNNTCTNSDHCLSVGGSGSGTMSGFKIYGNDFSNYSNWDTTPVNGNAKYHHDGVHLYNTTGNGPLNDFDIYNNYFHGACGAAMTGQIFSSGGNGSAWQNLRVFNNVLTCTDSTTVNGLLWLSIRGNAFRVYNNTIIGSITSTCMTLTSLTNIVVKNNVISGCDYFIYMDPTSSFAASDVNYNMYTPISGTHHWRYSTTAHTIFANWKTACGCDANASQVASAGIGADGVPTLGAAVIDVGVSLASLAIIPLNSDKAGNARVGTWDVGAYEYGASPAGSPPAAPTGLRLVGKFGGVSDWLFWAPNTESNFAGLKIYRSQTSGVYGAANTIESAVSSEVTVVSTGVTR